MLYKLFIYRKLILLITIIISLRKGMEFFKHILQMLFFFAIAIIIGGYRVKAATCASGTGLNSTGSCVACSVSFCI